MTPLVEQAEEYAEPLADGLRRVVRRAFMAGALAAPDTAGPVEPSVRPLRWLCQRCDWTGDDAELLRAPSPFDAADTIVGCPKCKAVEDIANACDEPGCGQEATCGFPAPGGYRRTCGKHLQWWDERPNAQRTGDQRP